MACSILRPTLSTRRRSVLSLHHHRHNNNQYHWSSCSSSSSLLSTFLLLTTRRTKSSSSSHSSNNNDNDNTNNNTTTTSSSSYQTNKGQIEGVWVFHRHGDRTPARPLTADHQIEYESEFWRTKIPHPDISAYERLSECYEPNIHVSNNDGKFLDVKKEPFGFLTYRGMEQMRTTGRRFRVRYRQYGHHVMGRRNDDDNNFLDDWDVKAYSTNYLRTVLSLQCFLDGLMDTSCTPIFTTEEGGVINNGKKSQYSNDTTTHHDNKPILQVNVRARHADTLNAFDRNPEMMMSLVSDVVTTRAFESKDADAAPLAARLANYLPGLTKPGQKLFGGPSGINWIHAADHFVCRSSHNVRYTQFSQYENDPIVEETLCAMAHPTVAHLAWRFRQWYSSPRLLAAIAAPPLKEIAEQIRSTPSLGVEERRPFVVYSCHDVTILSLLYGIGADFLRLDQDDGDGDDDDEVMNDWGSSGTRYWPGYASTLVFELVRVGVGVGDESHVVRILLNGKPVRVMTSKSKAEKQQQRRHDATTGGRADSGGVRSMLRVSDFVDLVSSLEKAGEYKSPDDIEDSTVERDMAGWTG